MTTNTTISVHCNPDTDVNISSKTRYEGAILKEYSQIGRLNTKLAKGGNRMDIIDLMNMLPKPSRNLFTKLKTEMNYKNNLAILDKPKDKSDQIRRSRAAKILIIHDMVKKHGQRGYMINPQLIIPPIKYQETQIDIWNSL
jgi:hypothetical protein